MIKKAFLNSVQQNMLFRSLEMSFGIMKYIILSYIIIYIYIYIYMLGLQRIHDEYILDMYTKKVCKQQNIFVKPIKQYYGAPKGTSVEKNVCYFVPSKSFRSNEICYFILFFLYLLFILEHYIRP